MTNVDDTTKTRMNNAQETHTNNAQETHEADSQETRVEDPQSTHLDETHETRVEDTDKGSVKEPQETCLVESQENSQEVAQDTLDTDSDEARVDDSQGTREGADDGNLKSGSDREVVVQVYVPDEGQSDSHSDGLVSENTSQESRDKVEVTLTGNENDGGVTKIDLKPWEDPGKTVKKTSSRRAFGDNVVEKNLVNIIPRNSLDVIKGIQLTPGESKVSANRSFHSKTNHPRAPTAPKQGPRVSRRNPPDAKPLKVSNFELPPEGQGGVGLKPTPHGNKPQMSMHRLASKMSTNLEKVDEGSALETGRPSAPDKFGTAFNITGVKAKSTSSGPGTDKICETQSSVEKTKSEDDNVEKTAEKVDENVEKKGNEKTEATLKSSNKSLQLLMKVSGVCIDSTSFAGVVQGTPMRVASDDVVGHTSSASLRSNSSQPLVPSPPITSKPDMVSPRISRMMSRKTSNGSGNGSGNSRGSFGSANDMSPTASMEIVKLASNSSHGWVSSPTSSVKFLPPIDARASKASNRSDDSGTKRRPRTAESAGSQTGSVGSGSSSKSQAKPTVVEIRRSGSGDLRIDGSSSGLVGVKSTSSASSPKQAVVGF
ncbi:uncharacterized protein LOC114523041 [Dendronephthya gigantea]|uniref:uncharacterized protein LOC114523041 n=1 Tax=Dendronephthya gigantea TaxID=151771 RepID=UPI00106B21C5|nr:uncharacterized protein LOC114523041 [Dendronephthya gigantea]